ncbi:MAG: tetratricopeptide (TPR) repeat protein [Litorivivens sp.]|jgi:tetratricopeptide (TPR) repeat protein
MEFEERWDNQRNFAQVVGRYELMIASGDQVYFDIDELEVIIEHYFEKGSIDQAINAIQYGLELFNNASVLLLREAQIYAVMGKLSKAIPKLKHLLEIEPSNDEIYLSLASVYSQLRDHKNAISNFKLALKNSEDGFRDEIYIDLSLEYQSSGNWDDAIRTLHTALKSNPENETACYELAHCYETCDRLGLGIRFFTDFLDEHPYSFSAWYNLGLIFMKQEDYKKAINALEFCVAIEGEFLPALHDLATAYFEADEFERAIDIVEDIFRLEPEDANLLTFAGEAYEKMEMPDRALKFYDRAIQADGLFMEAYLGKAVALEMKDQIEDAVVYLEIAAELDKSGLAQTMLAECYAKHGARDKAENNYKDLTSRLAHYIDGWLSFSDFFGKEGEYSLALECIEKALAENPHDGALLYRKVGYLHALGHGDQALVLFDYVCASGYKELEELLETYPEILKDPTFALRIEEICKT